MHCPLLLSELRWRSDTLRVFAQQELGTSLGGFVTSWHSRRVSSFPFRSPHLDQDSKGTVFLCANEGYSFASNDFSQRTKSFSWNTYRDRFCKTFSNYRYP